MVIMPVRTASKWLGWPCRPSTVILTKPGILRNNGGDMREKTDPFLLFVFWKSPNYILEWKPLFWRKVAGEPSSRPISTNPIQRRCHIQMANHSIRTDQIGARFPLVKRVFALWSDDVKPVKDELCIIQSEISIIYLGTSSFPVPTHETCLEPHVLSLLSQFPARREKGR